jgi:hypothetical protein
MPSVAMKLYTIVSVVDSTHFCDQPSTGNRPATSMMAYLESAERRRNGRSCPITGLLFEMTSLVVDGFHTVTVVVLSKVRDRRRVIRARSQVPGSHDLGPVSPAVIHCLRPLTNEDG